MDAEDKDALARIERKLDYVVERQRWTEELIEEMTPVAREGMRAMSGPLSEWERKGWFAMARELGGLADRVVEAYGPDDVHELADHIVQILDTVRNLTQPDVLDLANDATDVLHHTEDVKPVGIGGMVSASRDAEVQRGMAVALEVLRHLGRARHGEAPERRARPVPRDAVTPRTPTPGPARSVDDMAPPPRPLDASSPDRVVSWEGHDFSPEGFLLDPSAWSEELAGKMATGLGLELTDDHWTVLRWARSDYLEHGASPNVRRVAAGSGVGTRRMYELFPKSPGKTTAMLAGIPKPVGCV